jgi:hypothetical protein
LTSSSKSFFCLFLNWEYSFSDISIKEEPHLAQDVLLLDNEWLSTDLHFEHLNLFLIILIELFSLMFEIYIKIMIDFFENNFLR